MEKSGSEPQRGVLIVSVDAAKRQFPVYVNDPLGTNADVESSARAVIDAVLVTVLGIRPPPGREITLIAVGSPASGKTSILTSASEETVGLKVEETFDDPERAISLVEQVIQSGRIPVIPWIYVDDPGKTIDRMVSRAKNIGRVDRVEKMAEAYSKVPSVLAALKGHYEGKLKVHVVDNSGPPGTALFIEDVDAEGRRPEDEDQVRAGWIQVYSTNKKFKENPNFEVPY